MQIVGSLLLCQGEGKPERRAFSRCALDANLSSVLFNQRTADIKPKTQTHIGGMDWQSMIVDLVEAVPDVELFLL